MHKDPNDPKVMWMTESEMRAYMQPSKWGLILILCSGPLGAIAASLIWHFANR